MSDLIHAAAIVVLLPRLLGEGEVVTNRPSLAAGNDPARPFDLETNLRVAEFKLSQWAGADAMTKRKCSRTWCTWLPMNRGDVQSSPSSDTRQSTSSDGRGRMRHGRSTASPRRAGSSSSGSVHWRSGLPTSPPARPTCEDHGSPRLDSRAWSGDEQDRLTATTRSRRRVDARSRPGGGRTAVAGPASPAKGSSPTPAPLLTRRSPP